jgi:hypothetical protein
MAARIMRKATTAASRDLRLDLRSVRLVRFFAISLTLVDTKNPAWKLLDERAAKEAAPARGELTNAARGNRTSSAAFGSQTAGPFLPEDFPCHVL